MFLIYYSRASTYFLCSIISFIVILLRVAPIFYFILTFDLQLDNLFQVTEKIETYFQNNSSNVANFGVYYNKNINSIDIFLYSKSVLLSLLFWQLSIRISTVEFFLKLQQSNNLPSWETQKICWNRIFVNNFFNAISVWSGCSNIRMSLYKFLDK